MMSFSHHDSLFQPLWRVLFVIGAVFISADSPFMWKSSFEIFNQIAPVWGLSLPGKGKQRPIYWADLLKDELLLCSCIFHVCVCVWVCVQRYTQQQQHHFICFVVPFSSSLTFTGAEIEAVTGWSDQSAFCMFVLCCAQSILIVSYFNLYLCHWSKVNRNALYPKWLIWVPVLFLFSLL